jgi:hypothetical protein
MKKELKKGGKLTKIGVNWPHCANNYVLEHWSTKPIEDFKIMKIYLFINQRFGSFLGRYLVLMETKPKKLNKSLWNQDGPIQV